MKELRIGNWILAGGEPQQVYQLDTGGQTFCRINDVRVRKTTGAVLETHEDRYAPIPLTPEILLACGFRHEIHDDSSYYIQNDIWFCHIGEDWYLATHQEYKPFQSLHQLQNIFFALTGNELIYKPTPQPA